MRDIQNFLCGKNLKLLAKGKWFANQLVVWLLVKNRKEMKISKGFSNQIQRKWKMLLYKFPSLFNGPTVRLVDYYEVGCDLALEVLPSDYKAGQVLGWLGASMVLLTSDDYLISQLPTSQFIAICGRGIRSLGCTFTDENFINCIIDEIFEETGIVIGKKKLTFVGLVEVRYSRTAECPIKSLVVKVRLKESLKELLNLFNKTKGNRGYKYEGELVALKLSKRSMHNLLCDKRYAKVTRLNLALAAESEIGNFGIKL